MNEKLLLPDLVQALVNEGYDRAQAEAFCRSLFSQIERGVFAGETVKVNGLGNFKLQPVDARKSVDVTTGEAIEIKGHYKFSYTPDASFKEAVNRPYAHLESVDLPEQEEGPLFEVLDLEDTSAQNTPIQPLAHIQPDVFEPDESSKSRASLTESAEEAEKTAVLESVPEHISENTLEKPTTVEHPETDPMPESEDDNRNRKGLWWNILLGLLLLAGVLYLLFYFFRPDQRQSLPSEPEGMMAEPETEAVSILSDSLAVSTEDSTLLSEAAAPSDSLEAEKLPQTASAVSDQPSDWPIRESVVVEPGSRLTLLAQKAYGSKSFWVYLFEANRDVLKNPNVLPAGAKIRIPEIPAQLLDMNRPETKEKIQQLEEALKKEFD